LAVAVVSMGSGSATRPSILAAGSISASLAEDDPRHDAWYVQYMNRPRGESYLNYAFRNNWLPVGWRVEMASDGSPVYVNGVNGTMQQTPPVTPPSWLTAPYGDEFGRMGPVWTYKKHAWDKFSMAVDHQPSPTDWGVGLAPTGSSPSTRAAYWAFTHPVASYNAKKEWYSRGGVNMAARQMPRMKGDWMPLVDEFESLEKHDRAEKELNDAEEDYADQPPPEMPKVEDA